MNMELDSWNVSPVLLLSFTNSCCLATEKLPESIKVFGGHNSYYLDCCRSERGFYVKLSEIRGANRSSIGIPRDMIDEMVDALQKMKLRIPQ